MATDIWWPPGTVMWRNGAAPTTSARAANKAVSTGKAKPLNNKAPSAKTSSGSPTSFVGNNARSMSRLDQLFSVIKGYTFLNTLLRYQGYTLNNTLARLE